MLPNSAGLNCAFLAVLAFGTVASAEEHPGWPMSLSFYSNPVIADLDEDGKLEILVAGFNGDLTEGVFAFHEDGTEVDGWPYRPNEAYVSLQPRVGNVDSDSGVEVVIVRLDDLVFVLTADGKIEDGWPVDVRPGRVKIITKFNLADLDGDGDLEILILEQGQRYLHAYHGDGTIVEGWPVYVRPDITASEIYFTHMASGDLDFDGTSEVVVSAIVYNGGSNEYGVPVLVLNGDGSVRDPWPWQFSDSEALLYPGIADIDGDYSCEIFGVSLWGDFVFTEDARKYFARQGHSGGYPRSSAAADLNGDGSIEWIVPKNTLRIYASHYVSGADATLAETGGDDSYHIFDGVSCGDVDGDGDQEIMAWSRANGDLSDFQYVLHLFDKDLNEMPGWPLVHDVGSGDLSQFPCTVLADLDNDGDMEGIYAFAGQIHVLDFEKTGDLDCKSEWPMLGHDATFGYNYHYGNPPSQVFVRGDANRDERVNIADAVLQLRYLFEGLENDCPAAFDLDADGKLSLGDAIGLLDFLFGDGKAPAAPYPECGVKSKGEKLRCINFECP